MFKDRFAQDWPVVHLLTTVRQEAARGKKDAVHKASGKPPRVKVPRAKVCGDVCAVDATFFLPITLTGCRVKDCSLDNKYECTCELCRFYCDLGLTSVDPRGKLCLQGRDQAPQTTRPDLAIGGVIRIQQKGTRSTTFSDPLPRVRR